MGNLANLAAIDSRRSPCQDLCRENPPQSHCRAAKQSRVAEVILRALPVPSSVAFSISARTIGPLTEEKGKKGRRRKKEKGIPPSGRQSRQRCLQTVDRFVSRVLIFLQRL